MVRSQQGNGGGAQQPGAAVHG